MTDKRSLRRDLRARRAAASQRPVRPADAYLARLQPGTVVASYAPIGSEADPAPFVSAARAAGAVLALPHVVDHATPLRFLLWEDAAELVTGPFGLVQLPAHVAEVEPAIILTPLVGFDRNGNRIGQGAGHYDRAFAAHPRAWRVGIALAVQEVPALVPDAWDVPLHAIATDAEWIVP